MKAVGIDDPCGPVMLLNLRAYGSASRLYAGAETKHPRLKTWSKVRHERKWWWSSGKMTVDKSPYSTHILPSLTWLSPPQLLTISANKMQCEAPYLPRPSLSPSPLQGLCSAKVAGGNAQGHRSGMSEVCLGSAWAQSNRGLTPRALPPKNMASRHLARRKSSCRSGRPSCRASGCTGATGHREPADLSWRKVALRHALVKNFKINWGRHPC